MINESHKIPNINDKTHTHTHTQIYLLLQKSLNFT